MIVRLATPRDIIGMAAMGRGMHAESNYAPVAYNTARTRAFLRWLIDSPGIGIALVADAGGGEFVGLLLGLLAPAWFGDGTQRIAEELVLYVPPYARGTSAAPRLVDQFKAWAIASGAKQVRAGTSAGAAGQAAGRLYEHAGFALVGHCYLLDVASIDAAKGVDKETDYVVAE